MIKSQLVQERIQRKGGEQEGERGPVFDESANIHVETKQNYRKKKNRECPRGDLCRANQINADDPKDERPDQKRVAHNGSG